eukprot:1520695-Rhodomonas_salina.1
MSSLLLRETGSVSYGPTRIFIPTPVLTVQPTLHRDTNTGTDMRYGDTRLRDKAGVSQKERLSLQQYWNALNAFFQ